MADKAPIPVLSTLPGFGVVTGAADAVGNVEQTASNVSGLLAILPEVTRRAGIVAVGVLLTVAGLAFVLSGSKTVQGAVKSAAKVGEVAAV